MTPKDESLNEGAEIMKAIGHPARIQILLFLSRINKKTSVTEIHQNLGFTQSETSRHLSILKNNHVLHCKKEGSNSYYFINVTNSLIKGLVSSLSRNL